MATRNFIPNRKACVARTFKQKDWNLYIGPAEHYDYHPLFHHFKWRGWWNFGTGALGDMGCHIIDTPFRVLKLGYPTEVEGSVGEVYKKSWNAEHVPQGCPPSSRIQVVFPKSDHNDSRVKMNWSDGGMRPFHPDLIPAHDQLGEHGNGVIMIGDKGTATCGAYGSNPKLYRKDQEVLTMPKEFTGGLKYLNYPENGHQKSWTEACKAGFKVMNTKP